MYADKLTDTPRAAGEPQIQDEKALRRQAIESNQELLRKMFLTIPGKRFFRRQTRFHLTVKHGEPYDSWDCVKIAAQNGWSLDE